MKLIVDSAINNHFRLRPGICPRCALFIAPTWCDSLVLLLDFVRQDLLFKLHELLSIYLVVVGAVEIVKLLVNRTAFLRNNYEIGQ